MILPVVLDDELPASHVLYIFIFPEVYLYSDIQASFRAICNHTVEGTSKACPLNSSLIFHFEGRALQSCVFNLQVMFITWCNKVDKEGSWTHVAADS